MSQTVADAKRASFVNRARVSANAGPWLALAGALLTAGGVYLSPLHLGIMCVMGLCAVVLQYPRQRAWRALSDSLEFASLAAMPLILLALSLMWLWPQESLSLGTVLQGLGGFFLSLGVLHFIMRGHTLKLADEIEHQR